MVEQLGIENRLQLVITVCVVSLVIVTTLGGSGGAPIVFFTYRTLLFVIAILSTIGSRRTDHEISRGFLALVFVLFLLMWISTMRIPGSHFEGFYIWYKYSFYAAAFLSLAHYSRYQSARWKALVLGTVVAVGLAHLAPDLIARRNLIVGFSPNNANYFATFLLIGISGCVAVAIFGTQNAWRLGAAATAGILLFGLIRTASRGATLAVLAMMILGAARSGGRIPRQVWMLIILAGLVTAAVYSPYLIGKFLDRGEEDPYNYARTEIWKTSLQVIAQKPVLGVGFGQFFHISKKFALPVQGRVARYMKRASMAHNEYLQHMAELGIPSAVLLFSLLGYLIYLGWKRAPLVWPEYRCFQEAAILVATAVGIHALVDNCWTIPVTASTLVVLSLGDILPLEKKESPRKWRPLEIGIAAVSSIVIYTIAVLIPGLGLYYNDLGHAAYEKSDFARAERYHLKAIAIVPNHPVFLDNLGMVYLEQSEETRTPSLREPASKYFTRAIAASPQQLDPHTHMETVLVRTLTGDRDRDMGLYRQILKNDTELLDIDPYIPFVRKNLASAYYNLGQPERAVLELQRAIEYEPNYVPGYLQIATWFEETGQTLEKQRYTAAAIVIANRYRNFKPTEPYEGVLLGRPEGSFSNLKGQRK